MVNNSIVRATDTAIQGKTCPSSNVRTTVPWSFYYKHLKLLVSSLYIINTLLVF